MGRHSDSGQHLLHTNVGDEILLAIEFLSHFDPHSVVPANFNVFFFQSCTVTYHSSDQFHV